MRGYRPTGEGEYDLDEQEEGYRPRPQRPAPGKVTRTMRMEGRVIARRSTGDGAGGSDGFDLTDVAGLVDRTAGGGDALPESLRGSFEESLGVRLADVRVHTDAESAGAARSIAAKAFTVGQDIYFADGQYNPDSKDGKHLLAHEVAHTAQQRAGGASHVHTKLEVSQAGDAIETDADAAADAMIAGQKASVSAAPIAASRTEDPAATPASPAGAADANAGATENADKPNQVTVTITPVPGKMELDAETYLDLYKLINARAQNDKCCGRCICKADLDTTNIDKYKITVTVTLQKEVPTWKQIAKQPKEHQDKFNAWAASVKTHEDTHYTKYETAYNTLKTKLVNCADQAAAEKVFTEVDEAVEKDQAAFDNDKSKQPAPLPIPGGIEKVPPTQRKAVRDLVPAEDVTANLPRGGGAPLPAGARARLETGLGTDLGGVRVHTDATAAKNADALAARAFASGQDVYFAAGEYTPDSDAGFRLLAHEVVHTVQQSGAGAVSAAPKGRISQPDDAAELEADAIADRIAGGATSPIAVTAAPAALSRKGRTASDLGYPETSDPWMLGQAQRNVAKPTPGWIGGSKSVTHADMLGLGYEYRGVDGNWRRYHVPGTDASMIFNILINPEVDPDALDPNDPATPQKGDPPQIIEAKKIMQDWSKETKKTLPIYDRLRVLREQGKGHTPEYQKEIDDANQIFDRAKEHEKDFQDTMPDWREELKDDPGALETLNGLATGDSDSLRGWVNDFDTNREPGDNQKSDDEWKQKEEELKKLKEELENPPPPEDDGGGDDVPPEDDGGGDDVPPEDDRGGDDGGGDDEQVPDDSEDPESDE